MKRSGSNPFTKITRWFLMNPKIIIMVFVVAVIALNCITVRKREGVDLERDDTLGWDELDPDRRRAWNFLGWTKTSWNNKIDSTGGVPNDPEQDKKDSITKYTIFMNGLLKTIPPSSATNEIKIDNARRTWLESERTKALESYGGWVNGVFIGCGNDSISVESSETSIDVTTVTPASSETSIAAATVTPESSETTIDVTTVTPESTEKHSINKDKSSHGGILRKASTAASLAAKAKDEKKATAETKEERGERRTQNATNKAGRQVARSSDDPDPCTYLGWLKKGNRSACDESVKKYEEKKTREKKRGRTGKQFSNIIRKWVGERIRGAQAQGGGYVRGKYFK